MRTFHEIVRLRNTAGKYPDLPNLHRYRLDDIHRMMYSIVKTPDLPLFVWIIEAMGYPRYRRLFAYD